MMPTPDPSDVAAYIARMNEQAKALGLSADPLPPDSSIPSVDADGFVEIMGHHFRLIRNGRVRARIDP